MEGSFTGVTQELGNDVANIARAAEMKARDRCAATAIGMYPAHAILERSSAKSERTGSKYLGVPGMNVEGRVELREMEAKCGNPAHVRSFHVNGSGQTTALGMFQDMVCRGAQEQGRIR
jgi:hypothetical protein